jgi:hypothetical protein
MAALAPAATSLLLATYLRHDSAGMLLAMCAAGAGALLAVWQVGRLMRRYGGLRPSPANLGERVEIAVSRPGAAAVLVPIATAAFGAGAFMLTANDRSVSARSVFALILFGTLCALWIGFDTVAVILTRRWEGASGLSIYCPRGARLRHAHTVHVAVAVRPAAPAGRLPMPALVAISAVALMAASAADLSALAAHESPWARSLPSVASETGISHIDPNLGAVVSSLTGQAVQVRCWSPRDWAQILRVSGRTDVAFANPRTRQIQLSPGICRPLMALRYRSVEPAESSALQLSFAVGVLGHEAGHLVHGSSESAAECFGMRSVSRTAELVGADPAYAAQLGSLYRYRIYPQRGAVYRAGGCPF